MENQNKIIRQQATKETLEEIYKVMRKAARELPEDQAKKYFYTEEELKELEREKSIWKKMMF